MKNVLDIIMIVLIIAIIVIAIVFAVIKFLKLSPKQQMAKVQLGMLSFCIEAEKALQRKTGQAKKSMVWNWIIERFPLIALFITEEMFDDFLKDALARMKDLLATNNELYEYVYGVKRDKVLPTNPEISDIYEDKEEGKTYVWDGAEWSSIVIEADVGGTEDEEQ